MTRIVKINLFFVVYLQFFCELIHAKGSFETSRYKKIRICDPYQTNRDHTPSEQTFRVPINSKLFDECCLDSDGQCMKVTSGLTTEKFENRTILICLVTTSGLVHDSVTVANHSNLTSDCCPGFQWNLEGESCDGKNATSFSAKNDLKDEMAKIIKNIEKGERDTIAFQIYLLLYLILGFLFVTNYL